MKRWLAVIAAIALIVLMSSAASAQASGQTYHIVGPGETLNSIAALFGTTAQAIAQANGLPNINQITVGQQLLIPAPQPSPPVPPPPPTCNVYYTVQRGDWLSRIAQRFGVTVQSIVTANAIANPSLIYAGQSLYIPCQVTVVHIVQAGERLSTIAPRYNTTVSAIVRANNIANPNLIYPGQRLLIPVNQH
jgi:LysM repeat protein